MATIGPGKPTSRVVMNRMAMNELDLATADGVADVMKQILARAMERVPVDTGDLRDSGDWAVFNGSRKVAGTAAKPRDLRGKKGVIVGIAGFGSPIAHLVERGTALRHNETPNRATGRGPAQPFLLPAMQQVVGELGRDIGAAIRRRRLSVPS